MRLEIKGLTKRFGSFTANDHIDLTIEPGEIHCLLGENGAGKSTLMNMLYGLLDPTEGEIVVDGEPVTFASPGDAIAAGIGMVHQHFMLVPVFTVAENVMLGREQTRGPGILNRRAASGLVRDLSDRFNLAVDPDALIEDIPVGVQQRVEILKALSNEARVLILDEPTAVLTPQEIDELMGIMRTLAEQGTSIIFITHKLREVKAVGDRITVIRRGKVVGTAPPSTSEADLAEMMVGPRGVAAGRQGRRPRPAPPRSRSATSPSSTRAATRSSRTSRSRPAPARCSASPGVQGNGQTELIKSLLGLIKPDAGEILLGGQDITRHGPRRSLEDGIGYIPEDRSHDGFVGGFSVRENLVLDLYRDDAFSRGLSLKLDAIRENAERRIEEFDIRTESPATPVSSLSGGNQQKVVVAREFSRAAQGARGLAADPRRRRRVDRVHPQADHLGARQRHRRHHRVHRAGGDLRVVRPDRRHVRRQDRGRRRPRHRPRGDRPADGGCDPGVAGERERVSTTEGPPEEPTPPGKHHAEPAGGATQDEVADDPQAMEVQTTLAAADRQGGGVDWSSYLPTVKVTAGAFVVALIVGAFLIALSDQEVIESLSYFFSYPWDFFTRSGDAIWSSYSALVKGSVGSGHALSSTVERAAPLICAGLGVTLAFRAGLFNIGAQGQFLVAGLFAGYVGFSWGLPTGLHLVVALVAALVGGAIWGGIIGLLKARTGAHEVITTIMLNYLGGSVLLYALSKEAFQRPNSDNPLSPPVDDSAQFPSLARHPHRRRAGLPGRVVRVVGARAQHHRLRAARRRRQPAGRPHGRHERRQGLHAGDGAGRLARRPRGGHQRAGPR